MLQTLFCYFNALKTNCVTFYFQVIQFSFGFSTQINVLLMSKSRNYVTNYVDLNKLFLFKCCLLSNIRKLLLSLRFQVFSFHSVVYLITNVFYYLQNCVFSSGFFLCDLQKVTMKCNEKTMIEASIIMTKTKNQVKATAFLFQF